VRYKRKQIFLTSLFLKIKILKFKIITASKQTISFDLYFLSGQNQIKFCFIKIDLLLPLSRLNKNYAKSWSIWRGPFGKISFEKLGRN
jgi:hypothetical protein